MTNFSFGHVCISVLSYFAIFVVADLNRFGRVFVAEHIGMHWAIWYHWSKHIWDCFPMFHSTQRFTFPACLLSSSSPPISLCSPFPSCFTIHRIWWGRKTLVRKHDQMIYPHKMCWPASNTKVDHALEQNRAEVYHPIQEGCKQPEKQGYFFAPLQLCWV